MKAVVLDGPDALSTRFVADPVTGLCDMLIRVRSTRICGIGIRIFRVRKTAGRRYPSVLGHEIAGEIVDPGGHAGFAPGDGVGPRPAIACGRCSLHRRQERRLRHRRGLLRDVPHPRASGRGQQRPEAE